MGYLLRDITRFRQVQMKTTLLESENLDLRTRMGIGDYGFFTRNPRMQRIADTAANVADTSVNVLVLGETGVGKNVLARMIHSTSQRRDMPFVNVDCSTLSPNLLESELFGHERGAFTGATDRRIGRFEMADGGTVFLDEIGNLDLNIQSKLLNVIEERSFIRVGGSETVHVDVRIISATNKDLTTMLEEGAFRNDLYYRIGGIIFRVPPLRDRREDIMLLADRFLTIKAAKHKRSGMRFHETALEQLLQYEWPGNVRELENVIDGALALCQEKTIMPRHLTLGPIKAVKQQIGIGKVTRIPSTGISEGPLTRQSRIMKILKKQKSVSAAELQARLDVSRATIVQDLRSLEQVGAVRTHGHSRRRRYLLVETRQNKTRRS
jgi:transcriptional regulator with PAS, ATPase and Fis domain